MLDVTPANLNSEYRAAARYRDKHLSSWKDRVKRYCGPAYKGHAEVQEDYDPENHEFEYLSLTVPKLSFDNPRVRITTTMVGPQSDVAAALQAGVNRWIRDVNLRRVLSRTCTDFLLGWGFCMVVMEEDRDRVLPDAVVAALQARNPAAVGPTYRPRVHRISPLRMFWDPLALDFSEARYVGHEWVADKSDMLETARTNPDAGWDYQSISGLSEDAGVDDLRRRKGGSDDISAPTRREVVGVDIWVPGYQLEGQPGPSQGYNGAIFTLALTGTETGMVQIREPRMYYGPPWGPYVQFSGYYVPDETAPLSPTVAIHTQVKTLNVHARAVQNAAGRRKRVAFVAKGDVATQRAAKASVDGDVVLTNVEELNNNLKEVELGGITTAALQGLQVERERRDRLAGMSDAMRGNVSGAGTATENAIADEAGATRMAFLKQQFNDAVTQVLKTVTWYLYKDDRVVYPVENPEQMGLPQGSAMTPSDPWFVGGMEEEGSGASFRDLDLEIEAYSMERTSEGTQQKRMLELVQVVTSLLPAAIQSPVNLKALFDLVGNMGNVPELGKIINLPAALMMQSMMLQQNMMAASQPTAALGGDTGNRGVSPPGGSIPKSTGLPGHSAGRDAKNRTLQKQSGSA